MASANVFISYAHADNESGDPAKRWLDRMVKHLKPLAFQDIIKIDTDRDIDLGQGWHEEIQDGLNRASAVVLLVSPDFLDSTYIRNNELPVLLYRAKEKGLKIIPVILRPCLFMDARFKYPDPKAGPDEFKLSSLQAAGSPSKALNEMNEGEQDRALLSVAQTLLKYTKERESQIVLAKSGSAHGIDVSIPNATEQVQNGVRLFGRDQLLTTVSTTLKGHDALLVYGMRGNGKTEFIQALGRLSPLCGKELVRIRASLYTTPEELFRQIAPLLGDTAEHPKIPAQLMQPQADELSLFPNARPAWVWIDWTHQLLTQNSWKNYELERLIRSLRNVLGQKWHWILELRERPPEGLMGKGCVEYEIPGLDKMSLSECIAFSAPQGQTEAWTYRGDNLKRLYQWLGGGHGEQAHPLTTHLLIEVARGLHLTPLQVRERHINDVVQKVEDSLLNDLFESVLSPTEQKLLQALAGC